MSCSKKPKRSKSFKKINGKRKRKLVCRNWPEKSKMKRSKKLRERLKKERLQDR